MHSLHSAHSSHGMWYVCLCTYVLFIVCCVLMRLLDTCLRGWTSARVIRQCIHFDYCMKRRCVRSRCEGPLSPPFSISPVTIEAILVEHMIEMGLACGGGDAAGIRGRNRKRDGEGRLFNDIVMNPEEDGIN